MNGLLWLWGATLLGCGGPPVTVEADARPVIRSQVVEDQRFADAFSLSATIEAENTAMLFPGAQGRIETVHVRLGDEVEKGTVLLEIASGAYRSGVAQAKSALAVAQAQQKQADATHARYQALDKANAVTRAEVEGVARQSELAAAQVGQAQAALSVARQRLADTELKAPFDGVIIARNVDPGDIVGGALKGPPLAIADLSKLRVVTAVNERVAPQMAPGQPLTVQVDALPGERFEATIDRINAAVDPVAGTVAIEASLDADPRLRHGMSARAIVEGVGQTHPAVPRTALLDRDAGSARVVVIEEGVARSIRVRYGTSQSDQVPVTEGLAAGQRVAIAGHGRLVDGESVREAE
ncbi:MAG: efflux RND transporter periplasmic adaptor subunit [Myxococcota bacterium]